MFEPGRRFPRLQIVMIALGLIAGIFLFMRPDHLGIGAVVFFTAWAAVAIIGWLNDDPPDY